MLSTIKTLSALMISTVLLTACGGGVTAVENKSGESVTQIFSQTGTSLPSNTNTNNTNTNNTNTNTEASNNQQGNTPVATKSVRVTWAIPSARQNGDPMSLNEIGGYEIIYRKVGESLFSSAVITTSAQVEYVVTNLEPGAYEFQIASFDTDNVYGQYSTLATINL